MADPFLTDVGVVIAAGGRSRRFSERGCKLLEPLRGLPLLCHCVRTFLRAVPPEHIVIVVPPDLSARFADVLRACGGPASVRLVDGGAERQDSVWAGLQALPPEVAIVAIQDAARPFTTLELLHACIASARARGSGVAAVRVTDTVKVAAPDGTVSTTLDRSTLWAAQTPQVFERRLITRAYQALIAGGQLVTDDAQAVERLGHPTFLVPHTGRNEKITYAADLEAAAGAMPTPPATASGTPAVAWPGLARQVFISRETDPWFNLALEEWLVRRHPAATVAVFVYRNRPCVVIGRNQNPWLECRIGEMRRRGVGLARRISGGGAVYHDLGNLNYTVVVPRPHYTREAPFGPVLDALRGFGLAPALDGRHAIRIEGRKVSGSAFLVTSAAALHHGSLLVSTDLAALDAVLNPDAAAFETHAVRSRPDVVANLAEWAPGLTSARVTDALLDAFGCAGTPPVELSADACRRQPGFLAVEERHRSRGWLLGHTPAFHRTVTVGAGGCEVRIGVTVREGVVESAAPCPADAVSPAAGRDIWQSWIGQPYDQVCDAGPLPLPPPHPQP